MDAKILAEEICGGGMAMNAREYASAISQAGLFLRIGQYKRRKQFFSPRVRYDVDRYIMKR